MHTASSSGSTLDSVPAFSQTHTHTRFHFECNLHLSNLA